MDEQNTTFKVGDGVHWSGYSDVYAGTVTRVTAKSVWVVEDEAKLLNGADSGESDALIFYPGGFSAHVTGRQRYAFSPGTGTGTRFTLRANGRWVEAGSNPVRGAALSPGRVKHHDYNF